MRWGSEGQSGQANFGVTVLVLATISALVLSVGAFQVATAGATESQLPTYDGAMDFPAIDGPTGPEEFSWEVALDGGQELVAVNDRYAQVYYTQEHHPAFGISAVAAHDADGSSVPTTLSVSEGDVITLTVHHRAGDPVKGGAPFDYPIIAGQGWEGGFTTQIVVGPPSEPLPGGGAASSSVPASSPCAVHASHCRRSPLRGRVGGPPTIPLGRPDEGERLTADFVFGRGMTYRGPVELVAYGWLAPRDAIPSVPRKQLCVWVEYLPNEVNPGTCNRALELESKGKVIVDDRIQALGPPAHRYTEIGGRLALDAASVQVSYRRHGHGLSVVDATIGRVTGDLQRKLRQSAPFAYFDARLPGLVDFRAIRVRAFGSEGNLIGERRG